MLQRFSALQGILARNMARITAAEVVFPAMLQRFSALQGILARNMARAL